MIIFPTEIKYNDLKKDLIKANRFDSFVDLILEFQLYSNKIQTDEEYLLKVYEALKQIINYKNFYVGIYNQNSQKYKFPIFIDEVDSQIPALDLDLSRSLTDFVRKKGKAVLLGKDDDINLIESNEVDLVGELAESWMGLPLICGEVNIGVLVIQSYDKELIYSELDLKVLSFFGRSITQFLIKNNYIFELQENNKHFNIAQDVSNFGSFELDVYNDSWWISPKVFSIINKKKSDINNFRTVRESILKCSNIDFDAVFFKFIRSSKELDIELEWISEASDKLRAVRIIAKKFIENKGRTLRVNGIVKDITEQRNYEIQLKRSKDKAEESDNLKTAFLSNMSHEIRTPMNAIVGFSDLLKDENLTFKERVEYINLITSSSSVLLKLIDDLIDIAKIESGQLTIHYTKTYINKIFNELDLIFNDEKDKVGKSHLKIMFESDFKDPDFYFMCDETRLRQVIFNFISNAIKFTETGYIKCYCLQKGERIEFRVKDTGIGISDDNRDILFRQFGQILNEGRIYQGTGLGLTISRNLINMLGGEIDFISEPGKGSTFYFSLPFIN